MCKIVLFSLISMSVCVNSAFSQGLIDGFVHGKGRTDVVLSYTYESYDRFYIGSTDMALSATDLKRIIKQSENLYIAHGLSDKLDLIVNLPFISAKSDVITTGGTVKESNLQNASVFLKWQPINIGTGSSAFSVNVAGGVSTPVSNYKTNVIYAIGNRATSFEGDVVAQYKFSAGVFANVQAGYVVRTNSVPSATLLSAKIGYAGAGFYIDGYVAQQTSNGGIDIGGPGFSPDRFPETTVNTTRIGVSGFVPVVKAVGITAGAGQVVNGRNAGKASYFTGGLVFRF